MEELDPLSPNEKITFKEHYDRIQYALEKVSGKNRVPLIPIPLSNTMAVLRNFQVSAK